MLPGGYVGKNITEVSPEPLIKKKRHYIDPYQSVTALTLYASWDKKVSFIVCELIDQDKSKLHASRNTSERGVNQDKSLRL